MLYNRIKIKYVPQTVLFNDKSPFKIYFPNCLPHTFHVLKPRRKHIFLATLLSFIVVVTGAISTAKVTRHYVHWLRECLVNIISTLNSRWCLCAVCRVRGEGKVPLGIIKTTKNIHIVSMWGERGVMRVASI